MKAFPKLLTAHLGTLEVGAHAMRVQVQLNNFFISCFPRMVGKREEVFLIFRTEMGRESKSVLETQSCEHNRENKSWII